MPKTIVKAFVYSFSVSLFAILAANRAFWHEQTSLDEPLNISGKNIVLFLKNTGAAKSPVKKIALSTLPEVNKKVRPTPQSEPEVILADVSEPLDFPLETAPESASADLINQKAPPVVLADVLYSPDLPAEEPVIEAKPVYQPELPDKASQLTPPPPAKKSKVTVLAKVEDKPVLKQILQKPAAQSKVSPKKSLYDDGNLLIPLQNSNNPENAGKKIKIGNPQDLNHVALNEKNIPIESMEKKLQTDTAQKNPQNNKEWIAMNDNPWVIAKSAAGAKNRFAATDLSGQDKAGSNLRLDAEQPDRHGVEVASETVKNLLIPIPNEIMKDENLTPRLAYPSSSEDARKEKIIDAKIKKEEKTSVKTELLSPADDDDDIVMDAAQEDETAPVTPLPKAGSQAASTAKDKDDDNVLMKTINSIFTSSAQKISDAKEKAIARAQAKRSFRKRLAKSRPVSIMPTEIKLSFQPNRAEISGQTLRWVQAFAAKAAETPDMGLEIRINGASSVNLQQKRLNLLHNILTNKGVSYAQINTVFTNREPNSFVLRTISSKTDNSGGTDGKINAYQTGQHIQW